MNDSIDVPGTLLGLHAEIAVAHELLGVLISSHPNAEQVLSTFRERIESRCRDVPPETDPEAVVEFRAHAAQHLIALELQTRASGSR